MVISKMNSKILLIGTLAISLSCFAGCSNTYYEITVKNKDQKIGSYQTIKLPEFSIIKGINGRQITLVQVYNLRNKWDTIILFENETVDIKPLDKLTFEKIGKWNNLLENIENATDK